MKTHNNSPTSPKPPQHKNNITSRFLPSPSTSIESTESPSPVHRKTSSPIDDNNNRRHKITEEPIFTRHQLWPSSAKSNNNSTTLADHITQDRIIEQKKHKQKHHSKQQSNITKTPSLVPQKSYRESTNTNHQTQQSILSRDIGGSARYTGRFFPSSKKLNSIVPGRFSLDENAKPLSSRRISFELESQSGDYDSSSVSSPARKEIRYCDSSLVSSPARKEIRDCDSSLVSSPARKEIPSRFMSDATSRRARRGASDSNIGNLNGDLMKLSIKRVNSISGHQSSKSQWALSPGRNEFSSPTKVKGVEKFLNFGFDLFKSKKQPIVVNSPMVGVGNFEDVHKLRLLDNRLNQWRYVNAREQVVNEKISCQTQSNLTCAWDSLTKLRDTVMKKRIKFAREKLEMKIAFVLYYQLKLLESWGAMERQHVSAITATKESMHSVVCKVPLIEGAKVNLPMTSIALRHAFDVTAPIKTILTCFPPAIEKTVMMLSELAKVVAQEKRLIEEFYDLFQTISVLQVQERSVKCELVQLEGWQRKYQPHQLLPNIYGRHSQSQAK